MSRELVKDTVAQYYGHQMDLLIKKYRNQMGDAAKERRADIKRQERAARVWTPKQMVMRIVQWTLTGIGIGGGAALGIAMVFWMGGTNTMPVHILDLFIGMAIAGILVTLGFQ